MRLRLTTFNLQNLFNRYAFLDLPWENRSYEKIVTATGLVSIASRKGDLVSYATTEIQRNNTAQAILDSEPDILAVQEVENIYTLRNFNDEYLDDYFDRIILIDGNDPRGIDVGLLVREGADVEIKNIRTNINLAKPESHIRRGTRSDFQYFTSGAVFSRDCLEVDVRAGASTITLLINHLKAQDGGDTHIQRRKSQAQKVREFCEAAVALDKKPIVIGDLNVDYQNPTYENDDSLTPLTGYNALVDPFARDENNWSHYYAYRREVSRLDYILTHRDLTVTDKQIVRKGLTKKCKQYNGERYPTIGMKHTEASDHCPVTVEIEV